MFRRCEVPGIIGDTAEAVETTIEDADDDPAMASGGGERECFPLVPAPPTEETKVYNQDIYRN